MLSFTSIVMMASALATIAECSDLAIPAPLAQFEAPVHVGYAQQTPLNIPPHGSQINEFSRYLNFAYGVAAPVAPFGAIAAPLAAPIPPPGPFARFAGPVSPYFSAPAPYAFPPSPYNAPFPYAPYGFGPFVR